MNNSKISAALIAYVKLACVLAAAGALFWWVLLPAVNALLGFGWTTK